LAEVVARVPDPGSRSFAVRAAALTSYYSVHICARIAALADAGEVLVSSTVKDLIAGSGIHVDDRGQHQLKGIPDQWHIYRATR
jgi:hypothetical protein